jgi:hypothetical protein
MVRYIGKMTAGAQVGDLLILVENLKAIASKGRLSA